MAKQALHYAVSPAPNIGEQRLKGTLNIIDVLLSKGLPIDVVDHKGRTPLHVAIMQKNTIAATLLIDRVANQNIQDHDGKKPADYLVDDKHPTPIDTNK